MTLQVKLTHVGSLLSFCFWNGLVSLHMALTSTNCCLGFQPGDGHTNFVCTMCANMTHLTWLQRKKMGAFFLVRYLGYSSDSWGHPVFTLSLGLLSPPIPSFSGIRKQWNFIKPQYEMLKLSLFMHKVRE